MFQEFDTFSGSPLGVVMGISTIIGIVVSLGLFVLKGFAILYMSKKAGLSKRWMSFVPFLNFILLGQIIGKCKVWGISFKNIGLWLCITYAVQAVLSGIFNVGYTIDSICITLSQLGLNPNVTFSAKFFEYWYMLSGGSMFAQAIPSADISYMLSIFSLVLPIIEFVLWLVVAFFEIHTLLLLFRKLNPQYSTILTILCIFIPEALGIVLFVLRKKDPIDYEQYLYNRARAYTYYHGGYNNPYSPYGNPYANNPYANPSETTTKTDSEPSNPFPEFDNNNSNANDNNSTDNPFGTEGFGQNS